MTPLQLAQAYTVLGSGGVLRPVSLIKRDVVPDGVRVLDQQIADDLRKMLREVVHGGTGGRARIDAFEVGGKTGTARKVGKNGYSKDRYIGMFAGLAPIDDPRLAIVVVIDDPIGQAYYGGLTAAPVFSNVAAGALRLLGVEPAESVISSTASNVAYVPWRLTPEGNFMEPSLAPGLNSAKHNSLKSSPSKKG